jgi:alkanesulfonate monooxygenase SsuD/methylene tetrahydromethanopterin reductase-like flavin-dependent oxidoreductase (luciferase family)
VRIDLLLDPFGSSWDGLRAAALAAEEAGYSGLWTWDHLCGEVHGADHVLESWTVLSALATVTSRVTIGPMVMNVANRPPSVLAVMAATLQEVSGGRLLLGLGAGGGVGTPYVHEQEALGLPTGPDAARRRDLAEAVHVIRQVWTGAVEPFAGEVHSLGRGRGFLRPDPAPPVVIAGFGPKMAELAGRVGDGFNTSARIPALGDLVSIARDAHVAAGGEADRFDVSVFGGLEHAAVAGDELDRLAGLGVSRMVMLVRPPYDLARIRQVAAAHAGA